MDRQAAVACGIADLHVEKGSLTKQAGEGKVREESPPKWTVRRFALARRAERHRTDAQRGGLEPKSGPEAHRKAVRCIMTARRVAIMTIPGDISVKLTLWSPPREGSDRVCRPTESSDHT